MNVKEFWDSRYERGLGSGYGSQGEQLEKKLGWLKGLEDIKSITEIGCGDFGFGKRIMEMYPDVSYLGYDISKVIVDKNAALYPYATFTSEPLVPKGDLLLCVDVLFHIIDDANAETMIQDLEKLWTKYLAVTAYEYKQDQVSPHVAIRPFDYKRFGEPVIREIVEEDGSLYFYLFKK